MAKKRQKSKLITPGGYNKICSNSSGAKVLDGFNKLGPITNFADLLCQKKSDPSSLIAAQQIVHLLEAWRFLSSATNAYLINSDSNAIHFAYYAQLRSAFSLFAFSGIHPPQERNNYYLDSNGAKESFDFAPTHLFAREIWSHWIARSDIKALLLNNIKLLPSVSLGDFEQTLPRFNSKNLTLNFGLDLCNLTKDHSARNTASYQPYWLDNPLKKMPPENIQMTMNLWGLLFKKGNNQQGFDVALIQYLVDKVVNDPGNPGNTASERRKIADEISKKTGADSVSIDRMLQTNDDSYKILQLVNSTDTKVENILSRGFFLTYMATLALKQNLSLAKNKEALNWIDYWLDHAGIWNPSYPCTKEDIQDDFLSSSYEFKKLDTANNLPEELWNITNAFHSAKMAKPEAFLAWAVV